MSMKTTDKLVAWVADIHDMRTIVFAATKAKARWMVVKHFWDAGYGRRGQWPSMTIGRSPRHDKSYLKALPPNAWCPSYVEDSI